jgi:hypothetical protein
MSRFLSLKSLKAKDIQAKLKQVSEDGALEIGSLKNGEGISCRGRSILEMTNGPEDTPGAIFRTESARCSKSGYSFLAK